MVCTSVCIWHSGPLPRHIARQYEDNDLISGLLCFSSGTIGNFEARVLSSVQLDESMNYLMSPMLSE